MKAFGLLLAGTFALVSFPGIPAGLAAPSPPSGLSPGDSTAAGSEGAMTIDTPIGQIAASPAGKAVLEKDVPGLVGHPLFDEVKGMSLKDVQPFTQGRLSNEMLKRVSDDLAAIGPVAGNTAVGPGTPAMTAGRCGTLAGMMVPAGQIGLPTNGAVVSRASMISEVPAGIFGPAIPSFCLVSGIIAPVDKSAWNIEFKVALPVSWNGRALLMGGGGFDGFIPDISGRPATTENAASPLERGYAVFASDGGHRTPGKPLALDGSFALNREALENWLGDALKKTRDVAVQIIERSYGRRPDRSYVSGGSGGGRETLQAIARWPMDWDGAVAIYPGRNTLQLGLQALLATQVLAAPGAYPTPEKRARLHDAALAKCDVLDGITDGLISDVRGCLAIFDPATATVNGVPLRCPGGIPAGPTCLSDLELRALKKINEPHALPYALGTGDRTLPGLNVYTSDIGRPITSLTQAGVTNFAFGTRQPALPLGQGMSFMTLISAQFVRYLITQDPSFDVLAFDIDNPGPYARRIYDFSKMESADLNLAPFAKRGGKLIMLQGTDDMEVSPRATAAYYAQLRSRLGRNVANKMLRLYEVPGYAHTTSSIFNARWDPWSALEAWAEQGVDPANNLVVTDATGIEGRTRPLCEYPKWPRYTGGDVNQAASFTCSGD